VGRNGRLIFDLRGLALRAVFWEGLVYMEKSVCFLTWTVVLYRSKLLQITSPGRAVSHSCCSTANGVRCVPGHTRTNTNYFHCLLLLSKGA